jgi:uncharacterized BrkB/YihY/UPF0761 family membrane protein
MWSMSAEPASSETTPDEPGHSLRERATAEVETIRRETNERAEQLQTRVPPLRMLGELRSRYRRQNAPVLAGHLAYRAFLFMLPLLVLAIAALGFARGGGVNVQHDVGGRLGLGHAVSASLANTSNDAKDGRWALLFSGLFALLLTGYGLLTALHYCYAQAWGMEISKLRRRASGVAKLIGGILLVFIVIAGVSALKHLGPIVGGASGLAAMGIVGACIFGVSILLPHRSTSWLWLLPGAVLGAVGIGLIVVFATVFLPDRLAHYSSLYGSLGVAVTMLFVLLLIANVLIGSALVNAVWWDHFHGPAVSVRALDRLPDPPTTTAETPTAPPPPAPASTSAPAPEPASDP